MKAGDRVVWKGALSGKRPFVDRRYRGEVLSVGRLAQVRWDDGHKSYVEQEILVPEPERGRRRA